MEKKISETDNAYSYVIARTTKAVEDLRPVWELMQWHPNADIDFYLTIVASRAEILRPHVIALFSKDQAKALIVGRVDETALDVNIGYKTLWRPKVRVLTVAYGGLLGEQSYSACKALTGILLDALKKGEADMIYFENANYHSPFYLIAKKELNYLGRDYAPVINPHLEINLDSTIEDFLGRKGPKRKSEWMRICRKLEKEQKIQLRRFFDPAEIKTLCDDIEEIAKKTYQRGLGKGFLYNEEMHNRLTLCANMGWLHAYVLYINGTPASFSLGTLYKNTLFLDSTGYDPSYRKYEPGTVVFLKVMEDLYKSRIVKSVDFGSGDAPYKREYSDHMWNEASFFIFSRNFLALRVNFLRTAIFIAYSPLKNALKRLGLMDKVKKFFRERARKRIG